MARKGVKLLEVGPIANISLDVEPGWLVPHQNTEKSSDLTSVSSLDHQQRRLRNSLKQQTSMLSAYCVCAMSSYHIFRCDAL